MRYTFENFVAWSARDGEVWKPPAEACVSPGIGPWPCVGRGEAMETPLRAGVLLWERKDGPPIYSLSTAGATLLSRYSYCATFEGLILTLNFLFTYYQILARPKIQQYGLGLRLVG